MAEETEAREEEVRTVTKRTDSPEQAEKWLRVMNQVAEAKHQHGLRAAVDPKRKIVLVTGLLPGDRETQAISPIEVNIEINIEK